MNILHVITRLILGGAQKNTVLSCAAQVEAGHRVWLAYGPIYGPEGSLLEAGQASGAGSPTALLSVMSASVAVVDPELSTSQTHGSVTRAPMAASKM